MAEVQAAKRYRPFIMGGRRPLEARWAEVQGAPSAVGPEGAFQSVDNLVTMWCSKLLDKQGGAPWQTLEWERQRTFRAITSIFENPHALAEHKFPKSGEDRRCLLVEDLALWDDVRQKPIDLGMLARRIRSRTKHELRTSSTRDRQIQIIFRRCVMFSATFEKACVGINLFFEDCILHRAHITDTRWRGEISVTRSLLHSCTSSKCCFRGFIRVMPGSSISNLCAVDCQAKARLEVKNVVMDSDFELSRVNIAGSLVFERCGFLTAMKMSDCRFGYISFEGTFLRAGSTITQCDLGKEPNFREALFDGDVALNNVRCTGSADFHRAVIRPPFTFPLSGFRTDFSSISSHLSLARRLWLKAEEDGSSARWELLAKGLGALHEVLNRIRRMIAWDSIRAIGNLTAFTRSSYLAIVVIPIVAATWHQLIPGAHTAPFPAALALGFFAVVAICGAHLTYRLTAPELIRQQALSAYRRSMREGFITSSPSWPDRIRESLTSLRAREQKFPHRCHRNFARRFGRIVYFPASVELIRQEIATMNARSVRKGGPAEQAVGPLDPPESVQELLFALVDEAALAEYERLALSRPSFLVTAMVLYMTGTIIIGFILVQQSLMIARAAGWVH